MTRKIRGERDLSSWREVDEEFGGEDRANLSRKGLSRAKLNSLSRVSLDERVVHGPREIALSHS